MIDHSNQYKLIAIHPKTILGPATQDILQHRAIFIERSGEYSLFVTHGNHGALPTVSQFQPSEPLHITNKKEDAGIVHFLNINGKRVIIINLHLPKYSIDVPPSLLKRIDDIRKQHPDTPIIIGGDFNIPAFQLGSKKRIQEDFPQCHVLSPDQPVKKKRSTHLMANNQVAYASGNQEGDVMWLIYPNHQYIEAFCDSQTHTHPIEGLTPEHPSDHNLLTVIFNEVPIQFANLASTEDPVLGKSTVYHTEPAQSLQLEFHEFVMNLFHNHYQSNTQLFTANESCNISFSEFRSDLTHQQRADFLTEFIKKILKKAETLGLLNGMSPRHQKMYFKSRSPLQLTDEHLDQYVSWCDRNLTWATNFIGRLFSTQQFGGFEAPQLAQRTDIFKLQVNWLLKNSAQTPALVLACEHPKGD